MQAVDESDGYQIFGDIAGLVGVHYLVTIAEADEGLATVQCDLLQATVRRGITVFFIPLSPGKLASPDLYDGVVSDLMEMLRAAGHSVVDRSVLVKL